MEEVNTSECARHERISVLSTKVDASLYSHVRKDIMVTKLAQYKLSIVGMGSEIFEAVQSLA
jgi:hypothetical protein